MAEFYGRIQGNRGAATRTGSKNSGIQASAQSHEGSVIVYMYINNEGEKMVRITTSEGSSGFGRKTLYHHPLADLMKAERLLHVDLSNLSDES